MEILAPNWLQEFLLKVFRMITLARATRELTWESSFIRRFSPAPGVQSSLEGVPS
jgi:hypothetical protein